MSARRGLGRGLETLISDAPATAPAPEPAAAGNTPRTVPVDTVTTNPYQPRQRFDTVAFQELVESIREHGVIQPLLVREIDGRCELVAGERRLRAAKELGLEQVPIVTVEVSDQGALELALIENLQREDLNAIEEAEAYRMLAEKFSMTQDQIARRVGKARASVANSLRLLQLPAEIKQYVVDDKLQPGHAKVLLGLEIEEEQQQYAARAVRENLSVRNLEKLVDRVRNAPAPRKAQAGTSDIPVDHVSHLLNVLHRHFGTSVHITPSKTLPNGKKTKGSLQIDFFSNEDLDRILELLKLEEEI